LPFFFLLSYPTLCKIHNQCLTGYNEISIIILYIRIKSCLHIIHSKHKNIFLIIFINYRFSSS
jgi:hypothetical protein